jgi:hypothetical protein
VIAVGARIRLADPTPATEIWRGTVIMAGLDTVQVQWDHALSRTFCSPDELKEVTRD